jgi:hypothetical protein
MKEPRPIGRFKIDRGMIGYDYDAVQQLMARCVVVRCEMLFSELALDYVAISPRYFEPVPIGHAIPEYRPRWHDGRFLGFDRVE